MAAPVVPPGPAARRRPGAVLRAVLDPGPPRGPAPALLDPTRWTRRHTAFTWVALAVATLAGLVESIQTATQTGTPTQPAASAAEGLRAFLAALLACGLVALAASLRGVTLAGFLAGGFFIAAGITSWTFIGSASRLVWVVLAVEGAVFLAWTWPWRRTVPPVGTLPLVRTLPRLGTAWLGLAYWLLGGLAAVLVGNLGVAVGRFAYLALFGLGALAVVVAGRRRGQDLTVGMVAAFLLALAALLLVGSGNALDDLHAVRADVWGNRMQTRFWGGPGLLYHPNSIAVVAVLVAVRIGADALFERWQRYAALAATAVLLLLVNSRTGVLYLGTAAVLHAVLVWRRRLTYPGRRATRLAVLLPLVLTGVIIVGSSGSGFLFASRYGGGDLTSGRTATWAQVFTDFRADSLPQQIFGDTRNVRGYVIRADSAPGATKLPQLTTDNAAVGALRRAGVAGVLAFLFGLVLLVRRALRRQAAPWFTMAAIGALATIATSDWLLGNTGGTLWILLLAGESYALSGAVPAAEDPASGAATG